MADNKTLWTWGNQQKYHEELMQEIEDNNTGSSTPVLNTSTGNPIIITDGADAPLIELGVYGESTQNGTPTPDAPIDIVSVGDDGTVIITVDNGSNITISAEITSGLPLCSIGDVRDELIYNADGTGKIIKRTGITTFDGSADEAWQHSEGNAPFQLRLEDGSLWESRLDLPKLYCSKYQRVSQGAAWGGYDYMVSTDTNGTLLAIRDISVTTLEEFKAKLNAVPMAVVYVLATPQEIELSAAEMAELIKLQTFDGVTNIYNDENADLYIKYWCDNNINTLLNTKAPLIHTHTISDIVDFPDSLPANGGNADTVNGLTVQTAVPADAVFTDTVYTLPTASESELGGIKVDGTTVTIDENGVITVNMTENIPFKILKGTVTTTTSGATEVKFSESFSETPTVICTVEQDDYTIAVAYTAFMPLVNKNLFRVYAKKLDSGIPSNVQTTVHWVAFGT